MASPPIVTHYSVDLFQIHFLQFSSPCFGQVRRKEKSEHTNSDQFDKISLFLRKKIFSSVMCSIDMKKKGINMFFKTFYEKFSKRKQSPLKGTMSHSFTFSPLFSPQP